MEVAFCIEGVEGSAGPIWKAEVFNTNKGLQFTAIEFMAVLQKEKAISSSDGKGAWREHVLGEWLWRSINSRRSNSEPTRPYLGPASALAGI
jgi:putative transposase